LHQQGQPACMHICVQYITGKVCMPQHLCKATTLEHIFHSAAHHQ
jgi:hypothetical protein